MRFPEEFLAELKSRLDIEEVIGRYVEIKHRGSSRPMCLCPFHSEKTPSFVIYPNTQSYYCFGCHAGGDAVRFVREIERLDYTDAVKSLAERVGLPVPSMNEDDEGLKVRRRCYSANREAARFFNSALKTELGKAGADYLAGRMLTPETVTHFGLGFAPDTWDSLVKHMRKLGYTDGELLSFDLAQPTKTGGVIDRFRNRVMFPVLDVRGNVIAFTGRILDPKGERKYMNSKDTVVYNKGKDIFGLNFAKNNSDGTLILVEGNMDVIMMHQAGFTNTVAAMGTAFTKEQISLLSRYCKDLYVCFDNDEAGKKATAAVLTRLANTPLRLHVVTLTGGKDADEIIKTQGADYLRKLISGASNDTEFALRRIQDKYDIKTDDGKLNYLKEVASFLASLSNMVEQDIYIKRVSSETGVSVIAIKEEIRKQTNIKKRAQENRKFNDAMDTLLGNASASPNPQVKQFPNAVRAEETLLATLLKSPDFLKKLGSSLSADVFVTDLNKRIFSEISSRITSGRSLEIFDFSGSGEDTDIAYMSYLYARADSVQSSLSECDECIKKLIYEKNKKASTNVAGLSDEDFRRIFEEKIKKMKNGGN